MNRLCSKEMVLDFLTDNLPPGEKEEFSVHIEQCERCQKEAEAVCSSKIPAKLQKLKAIVRFPNGSRISAPVELIGQLYELSPEAAGVECRCENQRSDDSGDDASGEGDVEKPEPGLQGECIGPYELLRILARGGMGVVYEAFHTRLKKRVAIKVLNGDRIRSEEDIRRFYREMEAIGRLEHPNIVRAIDAGDWHNTPYLVMEYVDGVDLARIVRRKGPFSIMEACEIMRQAVCGLEHAHENGVIHRDIKPSNLLVDRDGRVKLADLGIAQFGHFPSQPSDSTQSNHVMGTVDFMSPEQARNPKLVDKHSDIYSLGCTFFYLLTGKTVYSGDTVVERILAHREREIPSLNPWLPDLSDRLDPVMRRFLAKDPDERFQSLTEVKTALETIFDESREIVLPGTAVSDADAESIDDDASTRLRKIVASQLDTTVRMERTGTGTVPVSPERKSARWTETIARPRWTVVALLLAVVIPSGYFFYQNNNRGFSPGTIEERTLLGTPPEKLHTLRVKSGVRVSSVGFVSQGRQIFCGTGETVQVWDRQTETLLHELPPHPAQIHAVSVSSDESMILTGCAREDFRIRIFNFETGHLLRTLEGHLSGVNAAVFVSDDEKVLSGSWDGTVRLWNTATGDELRMKDFGSGVYAIAGSNDGRTALFGIRHNAAILWNLEEWSEIRRFEHGERVVSVAISPDGRFIASGSWDHTAQVRDAKTGESLFTVHCNGPVHTVRFSLDGKRVIVGAQDGEIQVWDVNQQEHLLHFYDDRTVDYIAIPAGGGLILTSTGRFSGETEPALRIWQHPSF